jgi:LmbE family N-acetylglucosaminyl deacetylase
MKQLTYNSKGGFIMKNKQIRVLVFGAHPDDCDFHMGGTAVKYARLGHKVKFVSLTNGNAGHHIMGGGQLARRRQEETRKVFEMTGIEYQVLDNDDGKLQADLATRENVIRIIREFKPDLIFHTVPTIITRTIEIPAYWYRTVHSSLLSQTYAL